MTDWSDIRFEENGERLYPFLQKQTADRLCALSGKVWTEQRMHDPGLTINDVLNYTLTDYDYRLHFNLEDYLCTPQEQMNPESTGLFSETLVSLSGPVTPDDYQALALKHIPELRTIRFEPLAGAELAGVYDVYAEISSGLSDDAPDQIRTAIQQLYNANRNLCEDLRDIHIVVSGVETDKPFPIDLSVYLDKEEGLSLQGTCRDVYETIPVRQEFPAFYGINDWGLAPEATPQRRRQAEQLKAYLSLFDALLSKGLNELKHLPRWFRLSTDIPGGRETLLKEQFLNNLERMYGENSNPACMLTVEGYPESREESIERRVNFLRNIPYWGRDRHKASHKHTGKPFGVERYLQQLFSLAPDEQVWIVEHTFFRDLTEPIRSQDYVPIEFPLALHLSVFLYGDTKRMRTASFRKGFTQALLNRMPAHLDVNVYWLDAQEAGSFREVYDNFRREMSEGHLEVLKGFIINKREKEKQI